MASQILGPVGLVYRSTVRQAALVHGVHLQEERSLLTSMFRLTGTADAVKALIGQLADLVRRHDAAEHRLYVADMERAEKRRAWWGRLLGRKVRTQSLSREEANDVFLLLCDVMAYGEMSEDADKRVSDNMWSLTKCLDEKTMGDSVAGTFAAVYMRYLQHDVRNGDVKVPADLRRQILGTVVPIDTW